MGFPFQKCVQDPVKHLKDIRQGFEYTNAFCHQILFYTNAGGVQGEEGVKILHLLHILQNFAAETGLSDYHACVSAFLKSLYPRIIFKNLHYWNYKSFA